MNQNYYLIASISFKHKYFKNGLFKTLSFSIAEDSTKIMKDLGIILKHFPGGFHLLSNNPELLVTQTNKKSLTFYFGNSDPYFINYTALDDYSPARDILYFNNSDKQRTFDENPFCMHNEDFVSLEDVIQSTNGTIEIPMFDETKTYQFYDVLNEELSTGSVQESLMDPGKYTVNELPEGLIHIKSDGSTVQKVYYSPNVVWNKPLGVLELFTNMLYQDYQLNEKVNYEVNFNNRRTIWKYFLTDPTFQQLNDLSIIDKEKGSIFKKPQKQKILENTDAIVFESKNKLPFSEFSHFTLQLIKNFNPNSGSGKVIVKNLPRASPDQLFNDSQEHEEFIYSHIYI